MSSVFRASVAALLATVAIVACSEEKPRVGSAPVDIRDRVGPKLHPALTDTIGQYAIFADAAPLPVEGYGIVAQLPGTGSGDMPPTVRAILLDQLYKAGAGSYVSGTQDISPEKILASNDVAAVEIHGTIPAMARKGTSFDLTVNCLPSSQATSLSGGLLWTGELKIIGLTADTGRDTHRIALGRGPVFLNGPVQVAAGETPSTQPANSRRALRIGRVIGGGRVAEDRPMRLQLFQPNWRMTGVIERAINSRFPGREKCASADSDTMISLHVPFEYESHPTDFLNLVKHMYLSQESPGFSERKAAELIKALTEPNAPRLDISLALMALGRSILPDYIQAQYTNSDPVVRFWCARAGAGLQDIGGMVVLQEFARDENSPLKKDAIAGVIEFSRGDTLRATITLGELLKSKDTPDRIAAYEGLVAIHSQAIMNYSVGGGKFQLDLVPADCPPLIYVTQRDVPRIALIGRPINLTPGLLYVSPDNALTVNVPEAEPVAAANSSQANSPQNVLTASAVGSGSSPAPQPARKDIVTLYWRSPFGDRTVNVTSTPRIQDIIARLGWAPDPKVPGYDPKAPYIGASYQRIAEMLAAMCKDQSIDAQFVLQKLPAQSYRTTSEIIDGARPEGSTGQPISTPTTAPATAPAPQSTPPAANMQIAPPR